MLEILAASAAGGFGSAFGRDVYKQIKNGGWIIWGLVAIGLITFGYHELVRKHRRGLIGTIFFTVIGSVLMIAVGSFIAFVISAVLTSSENGSRGSSAAYALFLFIHFVSAIVGIVWGLISRRRVNKIEAIERHNIAFMHENGLRNSRFDSDVIEDSEGNRLRVREEHDDGIIFSVVGRRGLRAAIDIRQGRMVEYSGVVAL